MMWANARNQENLPAWKVIAEGSMYAASVTERGGTLYIWDGQKEKGYLWLNGTPFSAEMPDGCELKRQLLRSEREF